MDNLKPPHNAPISIPYSPSRVLKSLFVRTLFILSGLALIPIAYMLGREPNKIFALFSVPLLCIGAISIFFGAKNIHRTIRALSVKEPVVSADKHGIYVNAPAASHPNARQWQAAWEEINGISLISRHAYCMYRGKTQPPLILETELLADTSYVFSWLTVGFIQSRAQPRYPEKNISFRYSLLRTLTYGLLSFGLSVFSTVSAYRGLAAPNGAVSLPTCAAAFILGIVSLIWTAECFSALFHRQPVIQLNTKGIRIDPSFSLLKRKSRRYATWQEIKHIRPIKILNFRYGLRFTLRQQSGDTIFDTFCLEGGKDAAVKTVLLYENISTALTASADFQIAAIRKRLPENPNLPHSD